MTVKVGINGFGRIGRLAFRRIQDVSDGYRSGCNQRLDRVLTMLAHLLQYRLQLTVRFHGNC
jgi:glyceraldehyde 3-phosphate dehydrogenase